MKTKYYTNLLLPLCLFCAVFRIAELVFSVEYSVDTYFFISGSVIPWVFNLYVAAGCLFFLSFWGIQSVKKQMERRSKKSEKNEPSETEKTKSESKGLVTEYKRIKKLDGRTVILFVVACVLVLTFCISILLNELSDNLGSYQSFSELFLTMIPYICLTGFLSVLFFTQFCASPRAVAKSPFWMILSIFPSLFYALYIFYTFKEHQGIISNVFLAYDFYRIAAIAIALVSMTQMLIDSDHKSLGFSASCIAVFLSVIRVADMFITFAVTLGFGQIVPAFAHLDRIDGNALLILADFFLSMALLSVNYRLGKKPKKKTAQPVNETEPV